MKHQVRWATLALLAAIALPATAFAGKADVTIKNRSDWNIQHLFLSPVDEEQWGPDQLGDEIVGSGDSFTLTGVPCDEYDVRLIDEDGDECVVGAVDICGQSQTWTITSDDLLACEAATEE